MSSSLSLPTELLSLVCQFLYPASVRRLRAVNKQFCDTIESASFVSVYYCTKHYKKVEVRHAGVLRPPNNLHFLWLYELLCQPAEVKEQYLEMDPNIDRIMFHDIAHAAFCNATTPIHWVKRQFVQDQLNKEFCSPSSSPKFIQNEFTKHVGDSGCRFSIIAPKDKRVTLEFTIYMDCFSIKKTINKSLPHGSHEPEEAVQQSSANFTSWLATQVD